MTVCIHCGRGAHEQCTGCVGCGCIRSAQAAHHTNGPHRTFPKRTHP